jgi:hypothetical protein
MNELNQELILAHTFIKQQYQQYLKSTRIKNDEERRAWAHAVTITEHIAKNTHITPKDTPNTRKRKQEKQHTELYNLATTD